MRDLTQDQLEHLEDDARDAKIAEDNEDKVQCDGCNHYFEEDETITTEDGTHCFPCRMRFDKIESYNSAIRINNLLYFAMGGRRLI